MAIQELGERCGLGQQHGPERLEDACQRALAFGAYRYASVASILKHRLDQRPTPQDDAPSIQHANIRGANYYDETITTPEENTHAHPSHP